MKADKLRSPHIPLVRSLAWIVGSALLVSGGGHLGIKYFLKERLNAEKKAPYVVQGVIQTLIQTGPQREALKTEYLAQLLDISVDRPPLAAIFDIRQAEERLRACPLIARAHIKLLKPSTLYIDYTIRQPIAWLSDYENVALDKIGHPIPFRPFFSPKNLPEIYIGLGPFGTPAEALEKPVAEWNQPLRGKYIELALKLLDLLADPNVQDLMTVKRIDVSNAFAESYGTREIIVIVEDSIFIQHDSREVQYLLPKILRLSTKNFANELGNFLKLRTQLIENERASIKFDPTHDSIVRQKETVIDFRIPNLAFVDEKKHALSL